MGGAPRPKAIPPEFAHRLPNGTHPMVLPKVPLWIEVGRAVTMGEYQDPGMVPLKPSARMLESRNVGRRQRASLQWLMDDEADRLSCAREAQANESGAGALPVYTPYSAKSGSPPTPSSTDTEELLRSRTSRASTPGAILQAQRRNLRSGGCESATSSQRQGRCSSAPGTSRQARAAMPLTARGASGQDAQPAAPTNARVSAAPLSARQA